MAVTRIRGAVRGSARLQGPNTRLIRVLGSASPWGATLEARSDGDSEGYTPDEEKRLCELARDLLNDRLVALERARAAAEAACSGALGDPQPGPEQFQDETGGGGEPTPCERARARVESLEKSVETAEKNVERWCKPDLVG